MNSLISTDLSTAAAQTLSFILSVLAATPMKHWSNVIGNRAELSPLTMGSYLLGFTAPEVQKLIPLLSWAEVTDDPAVSPRVRCFRATLPNSITGILGIMPLEKASQGSLRLVNHDPDNPESDCVLGTDDLPSDSDERVVTRTLNLLVGRETYDDDNTPWVAYTLLVGQVTGLPKRIPAARAGERITHEQAKELGLEWPKISRPEGLPFYDGYVGVHMQPPIRLLEQVPGAAREKRAARDGVKHHVTLVSPPEMNQIIKTRTRVNPKLSKYDVVRQVVQLFRDELHEFNTAGYDHQLEQMERGGQKFLALPVYWPRAQALRDRLGLPASDPEFSMTGKFHVTLGILLRRLPTPCEEARPHPGALLLSPSDVADPVLTAAGADILPPAAVVFAALDDLPAADASDRVHAARLLLEHGAAAGEGTDSALQPHSLLVHGQLPPKTKSTGSFGSSIVAGSDDEAWRPHQTRKSVTTMCAQNSWV